MSQKNETKDDEPSRYRLLFSWRYFLAFLGFFGYCILYMERVNISLAIVCMVNNTALNPISSLANVSSTNRTTPLDQCELRSLQTHSNDGPFVWNKSTQGLILSAFFYGYILTQIPGGWLAYKFGGKIVFGLAILFGSILTLITPLMARWSYNALIVCRFLTGFVQGPGFPSMGNLWTYWAPSSERSRLIAFSNVGAMVGNIISMPLSGFLCVQGFDGGWPSIFYLMGIFGVVWFGFFFLLTAKRPEYHKFISEKEKKYIIANTVQANQMKLKAPIKQIITCKACLAVICCNFSFNWGNYLYMTQMPSFLNDVLKFDIKSNGLISSLPYIFCAITMVCSSTLADYLIVNRKFSRSLIRKIFNGIGFAFPGAALIGLSFVDCSKTYLGVALLTIGLGFSGCAQGAGYFVNINEICGPFTSIFFGISNFFGTIPGIVAPYVVGVLTTHQLQSEWRIVFLITAGVYFFGLIVYTIFAEANLQEWAITSKSSQLDLIANEKKDNFNDDVCKF